MLDFFLVKVTLEFLYFYRYAVIKVKYCTDGTLYFLNILKWPKRGVGRKGESAEKGKERFWPKRVYPVQMM